MGHDVPPGRRKAMLDAVMVVRVHHGKVDLGAKQDVLDIVGDRFIWHEGEHVQFLKGMKSQKGGTIVPHEHGCGLCPCGGWGRQGSLGEPHGGRATEL